MLRHHLWLTLCALALSACPKAPLSFGKDGEAHTAEELLKRVDLAESQVIGLKGDARLAVDSPQGKGSVSLFLGVFHPAYIHLEQLDFFGKPQGVLTTDGELFGLYDAQSGQYFHGPATAPNLGRFLPLVLPPRELAMLLLGRVPRMPFDSATLELDRDARVYVLTLHQGPAIQTLHVDPVSSRVVKSHVVGVAAYDVECADLETVSGVVYPKRVVLDAADAHTRIELHTKDIALNETPDMTLFDLAAPEGVPVVEVDERGAPRQP